MGSRKEAFNSPCNSSFCWNYVKVSDANNALRARLIDVVAIANKKSDTALVDIRSPDEFSWKELFAPAGVSKRLAIRAGHIPGAVNVPWGQAVAEDGTFKSPEELKKVYAAVGIDGKKANHNIL
jgi:thiosulfate/3-mercaptopyruvate sulfurtransferase